MAPLEDPWWNRVWDAARALNQGLVQPGFSEEIREEYAAVLHAGTPARGLEKVVCGHRP